jgi:hypothetical protein
VAVDPTDLLKGISQRAQSGVNGIWSSRQAEMPWNLAAGAGQRSTPQGSLAPFATSYPGGGLAPFNSGYIGGSLTPYSSAYSGGSLTPFSGGYPGGSLTPFGGGPAASLSPFGGQGLPSPTGFDSPYATPRVQPQGSSSTTTSSTTVGSTGGGSPYNVTPLDGKTGSQNVLKYSDLINAAAQKYGLPPALIAGVIEHESGGDPTAGTKNHPGGAIGLMQIMPETWGGLGEGGPEARLDPATNIDGGAKLLSQLYTTYGNWDDALTAYFYPPGVKNPDAPAPGANGGKTPRQVRDEFKVDASHFVQAGVDPTASTTRSGSMQLRMSQFDASVPGQWQADACGPTSAAAFVNSFTGSSWNPGQMFAKAQANGTWAGGQMRGPEAEAQLIRENGVPTAHTTAVSDQTIQAQLAAGHPVILDTPGHYFYITGYDPSTGRYEMGSSASDLTAARGRTQYALGEINALGMGAPRALIVA